MIGPPPRAAPRAAAWQIGLVLGVVFLPRAFARAQAGEAVTVVIVAADATTSELVAGRVQDLLADLPSGAQIEFAERFSAGDLFLADEPERPRAKAWVSIVGPVAQVRVANAKRERFVFRDLVVAQPLTEIDRERIGQTLKAALLTVAEEGAPTLDRGKAEAALRIPARPSPPAPPAGPSRQLPDGEAPRPLAPVPPVIVPPVLPPRLRVAFAELYEVEWASASVSGLNGPGLLGRFDLEWPGFSCGAWVSLAYFIPERFGLDNFDLGYGPSFRAGVSVAPIRFIHLEIGEGTDWLRSTATGSAGLLPIARGSIRLGSVPLWGWGISGSFIVERASQTLETGFGGSNSASSYRYGFALEVELR